MRVIQVGFVCVGLVGIGLAGAGCTREDRSTLPPYVRDLRPAPNGVQMIQCELSYTRKESQPLWTWLPFTPDTHVELWIDDGPCWSMEIPTAVAEGAAP